MEQPGFWDFPYRFHLQVIDLNLSVRYKSELPVLHLLTYKRAFSKKKRKKEKKDVGLSPSMAYRIWCHFCFLCLFTRKGLAFSSPVYWWDVMGCLFFLSHLWHSASSYPHRPSTDTGGLAICFRHIFAFVSSIPFACLLFWYHVRELRDLLSFLIYMHFLTPEHSLNLSFFIFSLCQIFCSVHFFHSHHPFFRHSFVLVCLLHLGVSLDLYFRLVHFRLVCLGRTRGGLVLGFCNIAFSRQKASVLYIDLYIRTYIHMHIVNTEAFLVYLNYSITW